ncbi:MAG: hypothetical protein EB015_10095 [Methylocystaceae bacterium]|nr:hypothetical protein [Methylocystaceae bacterium]
MRSPYTPALRKIAETDHLKSICFSFDREFTQILTTAELNAAIVRNMSVKSDWLDFSNDSQYIFLNKRLN